MTHVDLFSGIGGFALAAQWAGFKTIAFCEINPYCQEIIKQNFGAKERLAECCCPILYSDIRTFPAELYRCATLLTAGPPCQPASQAGKHGGATDDRWLWPETFRVIRELHPRWCLLENVPGILTLDRGLEFERLLVEMEEAGYSVWPLIIPACAVDAKHRRDRVWIIAHRGPEQRSLQSRGRIGSSGQKTIFPRRHGSQELMADAKDTERWRPNGKENKRWRDQETRGCREQNGKSQRWLPEPDVCGMVNGISKKLDKVGGQINASENLGSKSYQGETPQGFLQAVWLVTLARLASQGWKSKKQLSREFRDTLRLMPYESTLGEWETALAAAQCYLHGLWKACEAIGALRNSSDSLVEVWQSLSGQEAIWAGMAAYYGPFYSEWPNISRVATSVKKRVDRLKGLGNAIVPQVAYEILAEIKEIEHGKACS